MTATLRQHQLLLLEMLCDIDELCRAEGIAYQLFSGSALGAVRHQGFVPWDDDVDVIMLRPEYERFLRLAPKLLDSEKYYVQKEFSEHWPMHFSKLRRNGTACIERYVPKDPETHQGVYIDIFPADDLSDARLVRGLQFAASKVVIAKCLSRRGYLTDSRVKKIFMAFCHVLPLKPSWRLAILAGTDNRTRMVHSFFGASKAYRKAVFPRGWFEESRLATFEGHEFPVSAHVEELLTVLYGDWHRIPPESERGQKKHAEIVDLENSYERYVGVQRGMRFDELTRSIR